MNQPSFGMITQWYDPEGGSAALPGVISRSLARRGANVDVLTGYPNYPSGTLLNGYRVRPYQRERIGGVTVHRAPLWPNHDMNGARRALNYLSFATGASVIGATRFPRTDANLVHMTPATAALPALALNRIRATPYVVHVQDLWPETVLRSDLLAGHHRRVEAALHRMCDTIYRHASAIAVTSPSMADSIEHRGVPRSKIHFVPNWADEHAFRPAPRDSHLAQELGIDAPFVVMYAGNFGEYQCIDSLLEAAALLRDDKGISFAIVGGGVDEGRLRRIATDRNLHNVTFVPSQPFEQMTKVMALGDIHYIALKDLPLFRSTIPSKVQATLAAGRTIVAAMAGDAADVLTESKASTVVGCESAPEIADAIRVGAAEGRESANERGALARDYYESTFSESACCGQLYELLESATRSRSL